MPSKQQLKKRKKYLAQYAEPIVHTIAKVSNVFENVTLKNALVIPAYQENAEFVSRISQSALIEQQAAFVIVINQPEHDVDKLPQQTLFSALLKLGELFTEQDDVYVIKLPNSQSFIFVVDGFTSPIPSDQGVGLARKIGCDLVIALAEHEIFNGSMFGSSDADAFLSDNYFNALTKAYQKNNALSAVCFNFVHQFNQAKVPTALEQITLAATQQYESALRYYVDGLRYAGSRFSFFTIGSILAISTSAYVDVRGFVKKSAGEDFYTLNKLAKVGDVAFLEDEHIALTPRLSTRVPFGTGPAVKEIIALNQQNRPYSYYHYQCFTELKYALTQLDELLNNIARQPSKNTLIVLSDWQHKLSEICLQAFNNIGFSSFLEKQLKQYQGNDKQLKNQVNDWFDAFKTLKFIHAIRALSYPDIPLKDALSQAPFRQ